MEQVEFQNVLLKAQDFLSSAEVTELVFLCSELLKKDLSTVTAARDLFSLLQNLDLLSPENPTLLTELLQITKRFSLIRDLGLDAQPQLLGSHISPYRRFLYGLSENISNEDLKNIKFLLNNTLPRNKLQQDMTILQLFVEMEKHNLLDVDNLDTLENIIGKVCPLLKKQINQYKTEHVVTAQETKRRSNTLDLSVTTEAVQPESEIQNSDKTSDFQRRPSRELLPPSCVPQASSAQTQPALASSELLGGAASRCMEEQLDNLRLGESGSQVQTQQRQCSVVTSVVEPATLTCPGQSNLTDSNKLSEYHMEGDRRGFVLIINNCTFTCSRLKNRLGTDMDKKRLEDVFQWLGFETQTVEDCDREAMLQAVEELRSRDHSQSDCVACCILSHGYTGGVYGVDGNTVELSELLEPLSAHRCLSLSQKPKLFFIQACQGNQNQQAVNVQSDGLNDGISCDSTIPGISIPSYADFLVSMATFQRYTSYRDTVNGTWFIQSLCDNLLQMVPRGVDLLSIMTQVNNDVSTKSDVSGTKKQIPYPGFTLTKKVVFPVPKLPPPL